MKASVDFSRVVAIFCEEGKTVTLRFWVDGETNDDTLSGAFTSSNKNMQMMRQRMRCKKIITI